MFFGHDMMNALRLVFHENGARARIHCGAKGFHGLVEHDFMAVGAVRAMADSTDRQRRGRTEKVMGISA